MPPLKLDRDANGGLVSVANDCCDTCATRKDNSAGLLSKRRESWGKADDHRSTLRQADASQQTTCGTSASAEMKGSDAQPTGEKFAGSFADEKPSQPREMQKSPSPLGVQSVMGAAAGTGGQVQFVPVPIITVPDLTRPPMPPMHAPQPILQRNAAMASAYAPASKALGPNMTTTDEGMMNAFTSMPSREQVALATNAFTNGEPAVAYGQSPMMPTTTQPMLPRSPYAAVSSPYATVSYGASSTAAAAPMSHPVMTAGYQAALPPGMAASPAPAEQPMLAALRDSLFPSQREWAVEGLATLDWHVHPEVVQALVSAARQDPAATVRAACVHHLAKMQVRTALVMDVIQKSSADADPRVRLEADQALSAMHAGQLPAMKTPVLPAASWNRN